MFLRDGFGCGEVQRAFAISNPAGARFVSMRVHAIPTNSMQVFFPSLELVKRAASKDIS